MVPKKRTSKKIQSVKGMRDVLPEEQLLMEKVYATFKEVADFYNFRPLSTPIVEPAALFERSAGSSSDIIQKEMYSVKARGSSKQLALRPEGTPGVVRAYLQAGMTHNPHPVKLAYYGPFFRHDKPQLGRYRQFHQAGLETFSSRNNPLYDAQIILSSYRFLQALKIKGVIIQINSIGCKDCRPKYLKILSAYYKRHKKEICVDCRGRLTKNPLRLLDCKKDKCQELKTQAPMTVENLCPECKAHFKEALEYLEELSLPYNLDHTLVRGLDYYSKTVFEFILEEREGESKLNFALGGGGRYDYLVEMFGGKHTPAVGVGLGVDRIMDVVAHRELSLPTRAKDRVFLIHIGELAKKKSLGLIEDLRSAKINVREALGKESLAAQLKIADKLGVKLALIFGQKEAFEGAVIIRNMETGAQETVSLERLAKAIKKSL